MIKFSSKTYGQVGYFFQLRKCFSHELNLVFIVTKLKSKTSFKNYYLDFRELGSQKPGMERKTGLSNSVGEESFLAIIENNELKTKTYAIGENVCRGAHLMKLDTCVTIRLN